MTDLNATVGWTPPSTLSDEEAGMRLMDSLNTGRGNFVVSRVEVVRTPGELRLKFAYRGAGDEEVKSAVIKAINGLTGARGTSSRLDIRFGK